MFVHTGNYVEQVSNDLSRLTYYTFTPRLLMDGGFYTMDDDLALQLAATHRSIGILEGILISFSERESFSELVLLKESCFTKMIDYPDFDLHSVLLNRVLGKADNDIQNITSSYQYVFRATSNKVSYDDIARYVLHENNTKKRVGFRESQIFLTKSTSNYRQYNPTAPRDIHNAMNDISNYAALDGIDALIKVAMCHYQFEMIHPYECYNGVIGRMLVYKTLNDIGLSVMQFLSLSECLYYRKTEYFEKLGLTQKNGNYSAWIEFFVREIGEAAQNSIELAKEYISITRSDDENLANYEDKKRHITDVYRYFKKNIVSSVRQASEQLHLSFNAVSREVEVLQNIGILTQTTSKSRNRLFAHAGLMKLMLP